MAAAAFCAALPCEKAVPSEATAAISSIVS